MSGSSSNIQSNQVGVQMQCGAIGLSTHGVEQSAATYATQSDTHQGELDGAARLTARGLNRAARQAAGAACETVQNLCIFMENAAQTMVLADQVGSENIGQLGGGD
ncbi:MAG: hypothetical protein FWD05_04445 [Oscillospiraceae bacterium]|nr:hypothetical protein [Oscillospiraceae bacterium]